LSLAVAKSTYYKTAKYLRGKEMRKQLLNSLHECGKELHERLRLKTFPVAVKMLERGKDIPVGSIRPKMDLGYHLATCQGFALSRRQGMQLVMLKEDMWCSEAAIGFGLGEPPPYFLDGYSRFPQEVEALKTGSTWAHEFPRFEANKYIGVALTPLTTANFEPDVVIIYCDSAQLKMLTAAKLWKDGRGISCTINNCGACVSAVISTMQKGKCNIALPCGGDRAYAACQDDELIFAAPRAELGNLVLGLRYLDKYNNRIPVPFVMRPEFPLKESYIKIGKMLGMELETAETLREKDFV
jgi:uncharacterized protein (DUF169 family)